jgi:hypothetical protein
MFPKIIDLPGAHPHDDPQEVKVRQTRPVAIMVVVERAGPPAHERVNKEVENAAVCRDQGGDAALL